MKLKQFGDCSRFSLNLNCTYLHNNRGNQTLKIIHDAGVDAKRSSRVPSSDSWKSHQTALIAARCSTKESQRLSMNSTLFRENIFHSGLLILISHKPFTRIDDFDANSCFAGELIGAIECLNSAKNHFTKCMIAIQANLFKWLGSSARLTVNHNLIKRSNDFSFPLSNTFKNYLLKSWGWWLKGRHKRTLKHKTAVAS